MDKEYYTLVQMSQQMSADGLIGKDVMSYFSTAEPYERILLTSNITASINTMIFSHQNITMVSYLLPQRQESLFSIMPMRQDPSFSDIPLVMESGSIALQVPHQTLNNYMKKDIISITRRFPMSNGEDLFIYVEAFPNFEEYFHTLEQIRGFPYALPFVQRERANSLQHLRGIFLRHAACTAGRGDRASGSIQFHYRSE